MKKAVKKYRFNHATVRFWCLEPAEFCVKGLREEKQTWKFMKRMGKRLHPDDLEAFAQALQAKQQACKAHTFSRLEDMAVGMACMAVDTAKQQAEDMAEEQAENIALVGIMAEQLAEDMAVDTAENTAEEQAEDMAVGMGQQAEDTAEEQAEDQLAEDTAEEQAEDIAVDQLQCRGWPRGKCLRRIMVVSSFGAAPKFVCVACLYELAAAGP
jgi:hypothetical protein